MTFNPDFSDFIACLSLAVATLSIFGVKMNIRKRLLLKNVFTENKENNFTLIAFNLENPTTDPAVVKKLYVPGHLISHNPEPEFSKGSLHCISHFSKCEFKESLPVRLTLPSCGVSRDFIFVVSPSIDASTMLNVTVVGSIFDTKIAISNEI